jgi:hypothetical protein
VTPLTESPPDPSFNSKSRGHVAVKTRRNAQMLTAIIVTLLITAGLLHALRRVRTTS